MYRRLVWMVGMVLVESLLGGCETPQFFTVVVYEDPHRVVRLQTFPEANEANDGKGFTHPAYVKEENVKKVLRGVHVELNHTTVLPPFRQSAKATERQRAFSQSEIDFFAPLIVKGLSQATPEEIVTFYETAKISDLHEITTSGGVFIQDDLFYVVLGNHSTKTDIWQDNEQYQAPSRLQPLEPIDPQPGRLVFDPPQFMIESKRSFLDTAFKAEPWQVGVLFRQLP